MPVDPPVNETEQMQSEGVLEETIGPECKKNSTVVNVLDKVLVISVCSMLQVNANFHVVYDIEREMAFFCVFYI